MWLHYWRDLLLILGEAGDRIANLDWEETLRSHAMTLSRAQVAGFLERLYETLDHLDRNANPRLTLEILMLDLPKD